MCRAATRCSWPTARAATANKARAASVRHSTTRASSTAVNGEPPNYTAGKGHLNLDYLHNVLTVGGRYVCGDPNSLMPVWAAPNGPLDYKQVNDIVQFIVASNQTSWVYQPSRVKRSITRRRRRSRSTAGAIPITHRRRMPRRCLPAGSQRQHQAPAPVHRHRAPSSRRAQPITRAMSP